MEALLPLFDRLGALHQSDAIYSTASSGYAFAWYYRFLPSHLVGSDLTSLMNGITGLQSTMNSLYGDLQSDSSTHVTYPYLSSLGLSGSVLGSNGQPGSLELLRDRVDVARIPAGVFSILIILLILFFVSLITAVLVDHQIDAIALLRSRGASSGQIFAAFFLQGIILIALITMGLSLFFAARMDVLSLRSSNCSWQHTTALAALQSRSDRGQSCLAWIRALFLCDEYW